MRPVCTRPSPTILPELPVILVLVLTAVVPATWAVPCPDADFDSFSDCTAPGCDPFGLACGDCDDAAGSVHPGALEICNHRDDDCDGAVDEGFAPTVSRQRLADRQSGGERPLRHVGRVDRRRGRGSSSGLRRRQPNDDLGAIDGGSVTLYSGSTARSCGARPVRASTFSAFRCGGGGRERRRHSRPRGVEVESRRDRRAVGRRRLADRDVLG